MSQGAYGAIEMVDPIVGERVRMLRERFLAGETFAHVLARPKKNSQLWDALYKRAKMSVDTIARGAVIRHRWHLLVLSEDWCGDSINTFPAVARLVEAVPLIDMRIIGA